MRSLSIVLIITLIALAVTGCRPKPPEEERMLAEKAFKDAALGKDCDRENYLAAEELLNQAREEVNKKNYDKAKELFNTVKQKSEAVLEYYRAHPDECMPKKEEKKGDASADAAKNGAVDEKDLSVTDPNWKFPVIHFDYNDYSIKSDDMPKVTQLSQWMQNFKEVSVMIEGHADERGSIDYNMSLGEKRAQEVLNELIRLGIDKNRLKIISYGEEKPAANGHDEAAWSENRRAEFRRLN